MDIILNKIKVDLQTIEDQKQAAILPLRDNFSYYLKPIFEKDNSIESISWLQYTQGWNDGEECEFEVKTRYGLFVNGVDEDCLTGLDWRLEYHLKGDPQYTDLLINNPSLNVELYKIITEFKEAIDEVDVNLMKELFGDDAKVTVYAKGGAMVEYYEHD